MTHDYGEAAGPTMEDLLAGWARELGLSLSHPAAGVEARWVSIESRQVLSAADLDLVVSARHAVDVLDRVVRSAAGTLSAMRQLGGASTVEPTVPWCERHEQSVSRCRSSGSLCDGVLRSGPADPTGTAATGTDPVSRDRRDLVRMLTHVAVLARNLDLIDGRWCGVAAVDESQRPGPGEENCRCCWSADQLVTPVSVDGQGRARYRGLCRRCGQWRSTLGGVDPPSWLVRKAIYKETITAGDWALAREQTAPERKKRRRSKRGKTRK